MRKNLHILFYRKKVSSKVDRLYSLMVRITLNGKAVSCSMQKKITPEEWHKRSQPGNKLFDLIQKIKNYLAGRYQYEGTISVEKLKEALKNLQNHEWACSCLKRFNKHSLSGQEIKNISRVKLPTARLRRVRDLFVFCYLMQMTFTQVSRLSLAAFKKLNPPPLAKLLVYLYSDYPAKGSILPISSLQKSNRYLKEVAEYSHINRPLTFRSHLSHI